jgi:ribonuclease HI
MDYVTGIFTDGHCAPNPGPGGWGFVWVDNDNIIKESCGGEETMTTNNRMELNAIHEAYKIVPYGTTATIYSDSMLCVKTINLWAKVWKSKNWNVTKKNLDMIIPLYELSLLHPNITVKWIKAHVGIKWNEHADRLAKSGRFINK